MSNDNNMDEFSSDMTVPDSNVEFIVTCKGETRTYDSPITLDDLIELTEELGVKKFSAYSPAKEGFPDGEKLKAKMFPYSGNVDVRELMAPKQ